MFEKGVAEWLVAILWHNGFIVPLDKLSCVTSLAHYPYTSCHNFGMAVNSFWKFATTANHKLIRGFGAGRAEFRRIYSESYRPYSYSLGGLLFSFFNRPKPVIKNLILHPSFGATDRMIVQGMQVSLFQSRSTELWINVTNEGKTTVKRMRARAKLHVIPRTAPQIQQSEMERPEGMPEELWTQISNQHREFTRNVESQASDSRLLGRPLPFSRTPRGTIGFSWVQADERLTFETDLTPKSDEASIRLIGIHHLSDIGRRDLAGSQVPQGIRIVATQVGSSTGFVMNPTDNGTVAYDLAVKFWIVAENLSEEVSRIFHIEIPASFEGISCTEIEKKDKLYKEFTKMLAV